MVQLVAAVARFDWWFREETVWEILPLGFVE
jgi:hypothetical protein